jgi:predicted CopG family antitoxin
MTSSISVNDETKRKFDELKPDDCTHDDFVRALIDAYRRDNGEVVDVDALVEEITQRTATNVELAAYRGVKAAHKDHG